MNPIATILADTNAASWETANGGEHRTRQIRELVTDAGFGIAAIPAGQPCSNLRKYCLGVKYLLQTGLARGAAPRLARRYGGMVARVSDALRQHLGAKVLLWEITHPNNLPLAHLARRAGYAIVAVPQNIEALAPAGTPLPPATLAGRMVAEVRALGQASAVFSISREEQWLLALQQIQAHHLPYHPPQELQPFLLNIRARRRATASTRLLLLGSMGNPATAAGMKELIGLLTSLPQGRTLPVDIAGFGTEALRPQLAGTEYRLHGSVDQELLADLMVQAKAMLPRQSAAVGVLCRIPEMLYAGVPIIANPIAARSATELTGVHVYNSTVQLHELIHRQFGFPPIPERPTQAEQLLIATLAELCGQKGSKEGSSKELET